MSILSINLIFFFSAIHSLQISMYTHGSFSVLVLAMILMVTFIELGLNAEGRRQWRGMWGCCVKRSLCYLCYPGHCLLCDGDIIFLKNSVVLCDGGVGSCGQFSIILYWGGLLSSHFHHSMSDHILPHLGCDGRPQQHRGAGGRVHHAHPRQLWYWPGTENSWVQDQRYPEFTVGVALNSPPLHCSWHYQGLRSCQVPWCHLPPTSH